MKKAICINELGIITKSYKFTGMVKYISDYYKNNKGRHTFSIYVCDECNKQIRMH